MSAKKREGSVKTSRKDELDKSKKASGKDKGYVEKIVKCSDPSVCEYSTEIRIKLGNNQQALFLIRHYGEEYYLILHQKNVIVAYPLQYRKVTPHDSTYNFVEFVESNVGNFNEENKRGKDRCIAYNGDAEYLSQRPKYKGFENQYLSVCCSCEDYPSSHHLINKMFEGLPNNKRLYCKENGPFASSMLIQRIVSIRKSVRHFAPYYAMFRFKNEKKIILVFTVTIIKKHKSFIDYYKYVKENQKLETTTHRYVLDKVKNLAIGKDKFLHIRNTDYAFDSINIPKIYNNYLLLPIHPAELGEGIKYDTLEYGCSYTNNNYKFTCIEKEESQCLYVESNCLRWSVFIPNSFVSDKEDACGLIGYSDESIARNENCLDSIFCIKNTVKSYIEKISEQTKGKQALKTKLPLIEGNYPYYIYRKKKNYREIPNRRSEEFLGNINLEHYIAYEFYKRDQTEFIITISNKKEEVVADPQPLAATSISDSPSFQNEKEKLINRNAVQNKNLKRISQNRDYFMSSEMNTKNLYEGTYSEKYMDDEEIKISDNGGFKTQSRFFGVMDDDYDDYSFVDKSELEDVVTEHVEIPGLVLPDDPLKGKNTPEEIAEAKEQEKIRKSTNVYDGVVFYIETLDDFKIINIIYSDMCSYDNLDACGVIVHLWNPLKKEIKARIKLECTLNIKTNYSAEKNLILEEGTYQKLVYFHIDIDKFLYLRSCTVHAYGAFQLYDVQQYIKYRRGILPSFLTKSFLNVSAFKLYSDGIRKFICCPDEPEICEIKKIPICPPSKAALILKIIFFSTLLFGIAFFIYKKYFSKKLLLRPSPGNTLGKGSNASNDSEAASRKSSIDETEDVKEREEGSNDKEEDIENNNYEENEDDDQYKKDSHSSVKY